MAQLRYSWPDDDAGPLYYTGVDVRLSFCLTLYMHVEVSFIFTYYLGLYWHITTGSLGKMSHLVDSDPNTGEGKTSMSVVEAYMMGKTDLNIETNNVDSILRPSQCDGVGNHSYFQCPLPSPLSDFEHVLALSVSSDGLSSTEASFNNIALFLIWYKVAENFPSIVLKKNLLSIHKLEPLPKKVMILSTGVVVAVATPVFLPKRRRFKPPCHLLKEYGFSYHAPFVSAYLETYKSVQEILYGHHRTTGALIAICQHLQHFSTLSYHHSNRVS
jgi:hypothetical protein